jgi:hypothetical protein
VRFAIWFLFLLAGMSSLGWAFCCGAAGPLAWFGATVDPQKGDPPAWVGLAVYWPVAGLLTLRGLLQWFTALRVAFGKGWFLSLVVGSIGLFSSFLWCSPLDLVLNGLVLVLLLMPGSRVALGAEPADDDDA